MALPCSFSSTTLISRRVKLFQNNAPRNPKNLRTSIRIHACPFDDQPILKDALKEPVAFMGGVFAGLLRLDLNEEPLKEWIAKTVEDAGLSREELGINGEDGVGGDEDSNAPQEIEIE